MYKKIITYIIFVIISISATLAFANPTHAEIAKVEGEKVTAEIGGNLKIESLQETNDYDGKESSVGIGIGKDLSVSGGINKGKTDSEYKSATDQAGIYAGKEGFDIYVEDNTHLKGGVIASEATPDKNKLDTGMLTYEDIENKAKYESDSKGIGFDTKSGTKNNPLGVTPAVEVTAEGEADSTTKSAIANGKIEIRNNPGQDISDLSRDPENALNKLGEIFDKTKVEEQRELASKFGEIAFKQIGEIAAKKQIEGELAKELAQNYEKEAKEALKQGDIEKAKKLQEMAQLCQEKAKDLEGWKEGGITKTALHAIIGGLMSQLGGNNFASGAIGAGSREYLQAELAKITDPATKQWVGAILGISASELAGQNGASGGSAALSGTVNNDLWDMTSGFKDGVIDGLKNDLIGIVEMVSSPIETANQLGEVASMIWEIGREGNYGELFDFYLFVFNVINENERRKRIYKN